MTESRTRWTLDVGGTGDSGECGLTDQWGTMRTGVGDTARNWWTGRGRALHVLQKTDLEGKRASDFLKEAFSVQSDQYQDYIMEKDYDSVNKEWSNIFSAESSNGKLRQTNQ